MSEMAPRPYLAIKVYNTKNNIGEIHYFDKLGNEINYKHYKIEGGKEILIESPQEERCFKVLLPDDLDTAKVARLEDVRCGKIIGPVPGKNIFTIDHGRALAAIDSSVKDRIQLLSDEEKNSLFEATKNGVIEKLNGNLEVLVSPSDLEKYFPSDLPPALYDNVDSLIEFGIARFMADQVFHLSGLLSVAEVKEHGKKVYGIYASKDISKDKSLAFNYRFTATNSGDAFEIAKDLINQLNGIMRKIWLAAWAIGNEKKKQTFTVKITALMRACYPDRKWDFGGREVEEFYQTLKSMKGAEFVLIKRWEKNEVKYNISLLDVLVETGETGKTPDCVLINLFNVVPFPSKTDEKTLYVGMPVKRNTLELQAKDTGFATWLQTRINQLEGGGKNKKNIKSYDFSRSALIEAANLQKTDQKNPRQANRYLSDKLERCKDKGIISRFSPKIGDTVKVQWG